MKLSDIISKDVPVLDKDRPLLDALDVLNEQEYESICIDEGGKMVGSISYRDILFRIGAQRLRAVAPESLYISGFMKDFNASASNDTSIRKAAKMMLEQNASCLPMFFGETFLGIVMKRSMLRFVLEKDMPISGLIKRKFPTLRSHDRVIQARKLILDASVPIIPILNEDGRLLGAMGEAEALNSLIDFHKYVPEKHQKARIRQLSIGATMKAGYPTTDLDSSLGAVAQTMLKEKIPALVVTESSKVVGIISSDQILEYIVGSFPEEQ